MVPSLASLFMLLLVPTRVCRSGCDVAWKIVPWTLPTSRHRTMNEWDGVCAKHSELARASSNDIRLVLLLERFAVFVVLVVREYTGKHSMQFGEACYEGPWKLWIVSLAGKIHGEEKSPFADDERALCEPKCSPSKRRNTRPLLL